MDIHVVELGETIESIAELYGVSAQKIIQDNEINSYILVPGQTIVITYPVETYTVQEGDDLESIASSHGISVLHLIRNNLFLSERESLYPGENLVIRYDNTKGKVTTSGFAYPYINQSYLIKTLPYLTYLSIFNYTVTDRGEIITYYDDTEIIQTAKAYGAAPLMLITTLSATGQPDIEAAYDILTNEALQEQYISVILDLVKSKGYYGVNLSFQYLNSTNVNQYISLFNRVTHISNREGIPLFITINPNKTYVGNRLEYERVDISGINQEADSVAFLTFNWAYNFGPPVPIASIRDIEDLVDYALNYLSPESITVGFPVFGYDWELPYIVGFSRASAMSVESVINLAREISAIIEFDELSQTPYIRYIEANTGMQHLIWFIDARSIDALMNLVSEYELNGTGIWNIMTFYRQMWLVINTQYEIIKVL